MICPKGFPAPLISIHAPRTGSDNAEDNADAPSAISIHAPRTGSDSPLRAPVSPAGNFNPRSPHGERLYRLLSNRRKRLFQSTLPARGATLLGATAMPRRHYFNPRSPHGERHVSDDGKIDNLIFQSTLPARGATLRHMSFEPRQFLISIHAPRTGSDVPSERCIWIPARFQSTLPARGATLFKGSLAPTLGISIHAPRTGSDKDANWLARLVKISIHAPRTGSDFSAPSIVLRRAYFNPRSPHGERLVPISTDCST